MRTTLILLAPIIAWSWLLLYTVKPSVKPLEVNGCIGWSDYYIVNHHEVEMVKLHEKYQSLMQKHLALLKEGK